MSNPGASLRAIQEQAFVLHSVPYKETSLIVELFTKESGRVPVVAKGAKRKNSALRSVLVNFQPLTVRYSGKSEVKTLQAAEWRGAHLPPEGKALFACFYLNELLMTGMRRDDPHPELFELYESTLEYLASGADLTVTVRRFELELLSALGFGVDFVSDCQGKAIREEFSYVWENESGWSRKESSSIDGNLSGPVIAGSLLIQLARGELNLASAQAIKGFTRHMLNLHIAPNGILSRAWMEQLIRYD